ncbi:MAG: dTMP kinase [Dehalococcoidia bacterium]|nr:dTMP kinase [Dehalococcoidia bacterium]
MRRGVLATLEGGEGAGKSTQLTALARLVVEAGREAVTCREPGGTALGERLRAALFAATAAEPPPTPEAELLVFTAARAQLVAEVIRPALARGAVVLCDRFADSTVAYQQHGRGLDAAVVAAANRAATGGLTPNLTVLLDLTPEQGFARGERGLDYLEREDVEFHRRVRRGFLELAAAEPARWLVLDATHPEQQVTWAAWQRLLPLLGG